MRTSDRRTRKRLATRRAISDVATRLFVEHGFDQVTIDQIADAADVGRMTVFNHFPRKEDLFFDRGGEARDTAFEALRTRGEGISPIEALRLLAHRMIEQGNTLLPMFAASQWFVTTALASEALKARARQMRDEFEHELAGMLAAAVERPADDAESRLFAALIVATWSVAFGHGYETMARDGDAVEAGRAFLSVVDQGTEAVAAAAVRTCYVASNQKRP